MPESFLNNVNEWSIESIGLIALDTRLGILEDPEKSKLNQVHDLEFPYILSSKFVSACQSNVSSHV